MCEYISIHAKGEEHFRRVNQSQLARIAQIEGVSGLWVIAGITGLGAVLIGMVAL